MKKTLYTCEECGGVFDMVDNEEWSDERAHEEALQQFGKDGHDPTMAIVCDDCYRRIMERARN